MQILVIGEKSQRFESCDFTLYVRMNGQVTSYSNVTALFLPQPTLLAEATITCRLVIPLHNAAFRQSVPSQILCSITYGFEASFKNQHCTFSCTVTI
jgi:hypothetical protein